MALADLLIHQGKVRDVYALDPTRLLMVASDRLSAFDVVLPDPVPGKGEVLTQLSRYWFERFAELGPHHDLGGLECAGLALDAAQIADLRWRSRVVRRLRPLPVEAVVRGYLAGSGWLDYQRSGQISGIGLPAGLRLAERLAAPIFTPSNKAPAGTHDEPIAFDALVATVGGDLAEQVRARSLALYQAAAIHAAERGILIADTKFEFGLDEDGRLLLMDEILTPDSSRFWPADLWQPDQNPPSFDKQYVRDYLATLAWDRTPPGPHLPPSVIAGTRARYVEAYVRLTGLSWPPTDDEA